MSSNLLPFNTPNDISNLTPTFTIVNKDNQVLYKIFVVKGFEHGDGSQCTRVYLNDPERKEMCYHLNTFHVRPHNDSCVYDAVRTSFSIIAGGLAEKGHIQAREEACKMFIQFENGQKSIFTYMSWDALLKEKL